MDRTDGINGRRLHFVGIAGCGMSGLARMCRARGAVVTGSDLGGNAVVAALVADGIDVALEQSAATVPAQAETVVISAAIPFDHPEVIEATRRGLEVVKYAAMLGRLMEGPDTVGVAIAGTHGKSSTTSMLGHTLIAAGLDPSVIVGAMCAQVGGGYRGAADPTGGVLLAEACEYDRSFHALSPVHGVILNVEADHLDIYDGLDAIVESFAVFARKLPAASAGSSADVEQPDTSGAAAPGGDDTPGGGTASRGGGGSLLIQHESPHRVAITAGLDCAVETLGFAPQADWGVGIEKNTVTLKRDGEQVCAWRAPMPGEHMAYNAAAAAVTAHRLGAAWDDIAAALASFQGLDRRMQTLGQRALAPGEPPVTVIDDYGHHPTEVDTTLRALRQHHRPSRLICVFQPHQHSRTRHLMEQFAVSFGEADVVIVPEIYFVRDSEQECAAVTSGRLVERLRATGVTAMHLHPFEAIVEQLCVMCRPGDLVVTMGAGDVWKIARGFLDAEG